ncbi:hypothetical protein PoB_000636700 [Plakobranchus ocellatus]|uniref:Pecanex-like protein n=1 Tax=Plakobranchus ocellatus TaxID=259542 RepID=A0AAV3YAL6_9GAST|nr:hypothetical protein PoB_000636700 [Plakobranchus ocellatus]
MGAFHSQEMSKGGGNVMILLNDHRDTAWTGLLSYLRQPIVYFYCALPLFAPSLILIIVPALDSRCSRTFLALGCFLFSLCVVSFITGVSLAFLNRGTLRSRKDLLQEEGKRKLVLVTSSSVGSSLSTPRTSSSALSAPSMNTSTSASSSNVSSRRSSRSRSSSASSAASSSGGSQRGNGKILSKSKTSLNKKAMRRKRGVKFAVERLPSLIEEDTMVRSSLSRGNSQATFVQESLPQSAGAANGRKSVGLALPVSKDNIEELKDYLTCIGLGGAARRETLPPAGTELNNCKRARSFDERDLNRGPSRETMMTGPLSSR